MSKFRMTRTKWILLMGICVLGYGAFHLNMKWHYGWGRSRTTEERTFQVIGDNQYRETKDKTSFSIGFGGEGELDIRTRYGIPQWVVVEEKVEMPGNYYLCEQIMTDEEMDQMIRSVRKASGLDEPVWVAVSFTKNRCLSTAQIAEVGKALESDFSRFDYTRYAWFHCIDRANYADLDSIFESESFAQGLYIYTKGHGNTAERTFD